MDKNTMDEGDRLLIQRVLVVKNATSEHQPFDEKYLWTLFSQHSPQVAVFQHDEICVPAVGLVRFNSPREAYKAKRTFPSLTKLKEKEPDGLNILDFDPSKPYAVFDAHKLAEKILQQEKQSLAAVSCYGGGWVTAPGLVVGNSECSLVSGSLPVPPNSMLAPMSASCSPQTYCGTGAVQGEVMPHYGQGIVGQWSVPYPQPGQAQAAVVVAGPHHQVENPVAIQSLSTAALAPGSMTPAGSSPLDYTSLVSAPWSGYVADPASTLSYDSSAPAAGVASCQPWFLRDASQASPQPATAVTAKQASDNADASPASWCCTRVSDSAADARPALPNASNCTTMSPNNARKERGPQVQTSKSSPSNTTPITFSTTASAEPSYMCSAPFNACTTSQTNSHVYALTAQSARAVQNQTPATAAHRDPVAAFSGHSHNIALQQTSRAQTPSPFYGQTAMVSSTQPMSLMEFQQHLTQLAYSLSSQNLSVAECAAQGPQLTSPNFAQVSASPELCRQQASVRDGVSGLHVMNPAMPFRGYFAPEVSCGYPFYPLSVPVSSQAAQSLGSRHAEKTQGHSKRNLVKMHSMSNVAHRSRAEITGSAPCVRSAIFANAATMKQPAGYSHAMAPAGGAIGAGTSTMTMPSATPPAGNMPHLLTVNQHPTYFPVAGYGHQMVDGQSLGLCAMPGFLKASSGQLFPLQVTGAPDSCNNWAAPTNPNMLQLRSLQVSAKPGGASMAGSAALSLRNQRFQSPPCQGESGSWGAAGSPQQGAGLRRCKSSCSVRRHEPRAIPESFVEGDRINNYHHHHQRQLTKSETKALKAVARAMSENQKSGKTDKRPCQMFLKPSEGVEPPTNGGGDSTSRHAPSVPLASEPTRPVTRHPENGAATTVARSATPAWGSERRTGSERCALQNMGSSNHCDWNDRAVLGPANGLVEKLR